MSVHLGVMKKRSPFFSRAWCAVLGGLALTGCAQQSASTAPEAKSQPVAIADADKPDAPQEMPVDAGVSPGAESIETHFPLPPNDGNGKTPGLPRTNVAETVAAAQDSVVINWQTSMADARELAQEEGKDILAVFLESKNSSWSRRIESEVFDRPAFAVIASKEFVFLRIDPTERHEDDERALEQRKLCEDWNIRTFPTVVLTDHLGRPYALTGYRNLGAVEYARHLGALEEIREKRDRYFSAANNDPGMRAVFLAQSLRMLDE